jgi:CRISPR type I-E-associated protein CasB/Cse2
MMSPAVDEPAIRRAFRAWWHDLTDADNDGFNRQRGPLARLRRIDLADGPAGRSPDVIAALAEEPFRTLCNRIAPLYSLGDLADDRVEDLVTAAVTLARIREEVRGRTTAQCLGGPDDDSRVMKEGRFQALMRSETSADLFDQARRLPDLLDGAAPVGELGASLLLWRRTPWVRRNWARDYYHLDLGGRERVVAIAEPAPLQDGA